MQPVSFSRFFPCVFTAFCAFCGFASIRQNTDTSPAQYGKYIPCAGGAAPIGEGEDQGRGAPPQPEPIP